MQPLGTRLSNSIKTNRPSPQPIRPPNPIAPHESTSDQTVIRQPIGNLPNPPAFPWGKLPQQYTPKPKLPESNGIPRPPSFPWGARTQKPQPAYPAQPQIDYGPVPAGAIETYPGTDPGRPPTRFPNRVVTEVLPDSYLWAQLPPEWKRQNVKIVIVSASGLPKLPIYESTSTASPRPTVPRTPTVTRRPIPSLTPRPLRPLIRPHPRTISTVGRPTNLAMDKRPAPFTRPQPRQDPLETHPLWRVTPPTHAPTESPPTVPQTEAPTPPPPTQPPPPVAIIQPTTVIPPVLPGRPSSNTFGTGTQFQLLGPRPRITPIIVGEFSNTGTSGAYLWSGSSSLVQDAGYNILVDSGSAAKRHQVIKGLALQGIRPENIDVLLITHGHPDHIGNDNLFTGAQKFFADSLYKGDQYIKPQGIEVLIDGNPVYQLTRNVEIWKTPGHTMQHNSVIVRNASELGDVAIAGDLFINAEDITQSEIWENRSMNVDLQSRARNLILCQVDFILPGHGPMFRLTPDYKRTVCNAFISYRARRHVQLILRKKRRRS